MNAKVPNDFEVAASNMSNRGLLIDLIGLLAQTKKWWLVPVLIVTLLIGMLILLSGTAAAPFIYTLF